MGNIESSSGMTIIELIVCTVIIGILASTALPLSRNFIRREKEEALKERLREIRTAVDRFRDRRRQEDPTRSEHDCYPSSLQDLVKNRVLRKIPFDPVTGKADWGIRSTTDPEQTEFSDNRNVFDVFSRSGEMSTRGTPYSSW
jgi:general secretion pathway protein G